MIIIVSENDKLFQAISIIVEDAINKSTKTLTIKGKIEQKIEGTDSYKINYQNTEIVASSIGQAYNNGDEVFVLLPNGNLQTEKFILGKTNNRVPSFTFNGEGLSQQDLALLQDIINEIQNLSSDNIITPVEKQSLQLQWQNIQKSYNEIIELRRPYASDINIGNLTTSFNALSAYFTSLLADMEESTSINGEEFRGAVGTYLTQDTEIRLLIQEALRDELIYKVDIFSTNGESFKNNIINTNLKAIIMRGKNIITNNIDSSQIIWNKLNSMGEKISNWEKTGVSIPITQDDVEGKQIFQVSIYVQEAIVARDIITIVDLNDIGALNLSYSTKLTKSQVFDPSSKTYDPDYAKDFQIIRVKTTYNNEDVSDKTSYKWFFNGGEINSDSRFEIQSNKLIIKKNITSTEIPLSKISIEAIYYNSEYQVDIQEYLEIEFVCISDGVSPYRVEILSENGLIFKNGIVQTTLSAIVYKGADDVTNVLDANQFRWKKINYDGTLDIAWNNIHAGGTKTITITSEDIYKRATFNCEIQEI